MDVGLKLPSKYIKNMVTYWKQILLCDFCIYAELKYEYSDLR